MNQHSRTTIKSKVFCMMSGGVDSSVAAALLVQAGYQVEGVFMKNWSPSNIQSLSDCPWSEDQKDAEAVCQKLGIPFQSVNFEKEYRQSVVEYFLSEYRAGRTPNPDVMCNREIKFGIFLDWARSKEADFVASGHYVRVQKNADQFELHRGIDSNKDQSYFLWTLKQDQLKYCLFPIGDLKKSKVRQIAKELYLPTAQKKDSQGICFIGTINVSQFLRSEISAKPGDVIGLNNQIIGRHDGAVYYTVGQRHGFKLTNTKVLSALYKEASIPPLFVVEKDVENNLIIVGETDDPRLYKTGIIVSDINWIAGRDAMHCISTSQNISAQIRYRQSPVGVEHIQPLQTDRGKLRIVFQQPIRAVASGQSIVFYRKDSMLGGGIID